MRRDNESIDENREVGSGCLQNRAKHRGDLTTAYRLDDRTRRRNVGVRQSLFHRFNLCLKTLFCNSRATACDRHGIDR